MNWEQVFIDVVKNPWTIVVLTAITVYVMYLLSKK